jgi:hypothetical protein
MTIDDNSVNSIEFLPLELNEGADLRDQYDDVGFLSRRGLAEVASGDTAAQILVLLKELSQEYGTEVRIEGERAFVQIGGTN